MFKRLTLFVAIALSISPVFAPRRGTPSPKSPSTKNPIKELERAITNISNAIEAGLESPEVITTMIAKKTGLEAELARTKTGSPVKF